MQKKKKNKHYHNNECQHCTPLYIQQVGQPGYIVTSWLAVEHDLDISYDITSIFSGHNLRSQESVKCFKVWPFALENIIGPSTTFLWQYNVLQFLTGNTTSYSSIFLSIEKDKITCPCIWNLLTVITWSSQWWIWWYELNIF
jgi:hypothetical protein